MVQPVAPVARPAREDERERIRAIMQTDSVDDATMRFVVVQDGLDYTAGLWKPVNSTDGAIFAIIPERRLRIDLVYAVTLEVVRAMIAAGLHFVRFEVYDYAFVAAVSRDMDAAAFFAPAGVDLDTGLPATWRLRMALPDAAARLVAWFASKWVPVPP
jgi:hypothetical protein